MGIDLAGGYRAGGAQDALLQIVKQRLLEQELQQREEQQQYERVRGKRLEDAAAEERLYQHGRDTVGDQAAQTARERQAQLDKMTMGAHQLAALNDRPFKELVDPETQGFGPKAVPAVGLPPLPGTNVAGVSPPAVRQGQVRKIDFGNGLQVAPRTTEELDARATLDEQRKTDEAIRLAQAKPGHVPDLGSFEDYLLRAAGRNPTPAQIEDARKKYNQSDDPAKQPPRERYSVQPFSYKDGTTGLVRVNLDTGEPTIIATPKDVGGFGKPSDVERQAVSYYDRAKAADENAAGFEDDMHGLGSQLQTLLPSFLQSANGQRYSQAQREFTEARLRKESGAAIPATELANDAKTYFVQPGDTPQVIAQKQASRARFLRGLNKSTGNLQQKSDETKPSDTVEELVRDPKTGKLSKRGG
jgi:hypothetical protein